MLSGGGDVVIILARQAQLCAVALVHYVPQLLRRQCLRGEEERGGERGREEGGERGREGERSTEGGERRRRVEVRLRNRGNITILVTH